MSLESPVRGAVHTSRSECAESEFILAGGDVFSNLLQIIEALDIINSISCLFEQCLVGDETICFSDICNTENLIAILEVVCIIGQFAFDRRTSQVIAVVFPGSQSYRAIDLEQSRSFLLGHLRLQSGLVLAACCCEDGNRNTSFLGVLSSHLLPLLICFRLEVQVIDLSGSTGCCCCCCACTSTGCRSSRRCCCRTGAAAAGQHCC